MVPFEEEGVGRHEGVHQQLARRLGVEGLKGVDLPFGLCVGGGYVKGGVGDARGPRKRWTAGLYTTCTHDTE